MLYQICNGGVRFAAETILENINFEIKNTEKIAVVGRNGCGKTTLLKLIAGEVELAKKDSDEDIYITRSGNPSIGYLKQISFEDENITLSDEIHKVFKNLLDMEKRINELVTLMDCNDDNRTRYIKEYTNLLEQYKENGGYYYEKDYDVMLNKFGFCEADKSRPLSSFSGGQQTKIAFIKLLLQKPDILLLDEPTNHLDIDTICWLEDYLKNYDKAVVIVSHDRMFLDRIVDVVYEIEHKTSKRYSGNYTSFIEQKKVAYEYQKKQYELQQKEIKRLTEIFEKFKNKPTKVSMARSKLKQIEHMQIVEPPMQYDLKTFKGNFKALRETGKDVLLVNDLCIGYDQILTKVNLTVTKGRKIGIIGGNGLGKSTFLKTIVGQIDGLSGEYRLGYQVDIGYFDQQIAQYTSDKTVLDDFWDEFPTLTQTEIRSSLGAFLFTGDDVFKTVNMLSGGEKVRLALCKIFKRRPNFLILDEPTNHMDIVGKETLESILENYEGAVLFVSHDRYFIKQVADSLLAFENGVTTFYDYGYEYYLEKREQLLANVPVNEPVKEIIREPKKAELSYMESKERARNERRKSRLEAEIEELDNKIASAKEELLNPQYASDYVKLNELNNTINEYEEKMLILMDEFVSLD